MRVVKQVTAMLNVDELNVCESYQRTVRTAGVNKIVKNFDRDALGTLCVGKRKDGSLWIVDGQQRWTALKKLGVKRVPCDVFESSGPSHEARIFRHKNKDRTGVNAVTIFKALLTEQNEDAVALLAAVESAGFKLTRENLNYSAEAMCRVWPSRFKTLEDAAPYARNPRALADKVYSNRMGNGEGEGHVWIGRGFLQLTGKDNYRSFASDMRIPEILQDPSLVETDYAFETALWFFDKNGLFGIADQGVNDDTIKRITRRVNGGYTGLSHRRVETYKIYDWLT